MHVVCAFSYIWRLARRNVRFLPNPASQPRNVGPNEDDQGLLEREAARMLVEAADR
jgi:hypothetical protein